MSVDMIGVCVGAIRGMAGRVWNGFARGGWGASFLALVFAMPACSPDTPTPKVAELNKDVVMRTLDTDVPLIREKAIVEDSAFPLGTVADAAVTSAGMLIVVDGDMRDVKAFDPDGRFVGLVGHQGAGPGEYKLPTSIMLGRGDTIAIADFAQGRILYYSPNREYARSATVTFPASYFKIRSVGGMTALAGAETPSLGSQRSPSSVGMLVLSRDLQRVDARLFPIPDRHIAYTGIRSVMMALIDRIDGGFVVAVRGDSLLFRVREDGTVYDTLALPNPVFRRLHLFKPGDREASGVNIGKAMSELSSPLSSVHALDRSRTILEFFEYQAKTGEYLTRLVVVSWNQPREVWEFAPCDCHVLAVRADTLMVLRGDPLGQRRIEYRLWGGKWTG